MGGLFSSEPYSEPTPQYRPQPTPQFVYRPQPTPQYRPQPTPQYTPQPTPQYTYQPTPSAPQSHRLKTINDSKNRLLNLHKSRLNLPPLWSYIFKRNSSDFSGVWDYSNPSKIFTQNALCDFNNAYKKAKEEFKKTCQKHYTIENITEVMNPFLYGFYLLRMEEYLTLYGKVEEHYIFHGTKAINNTSIIKNNLNWRLHGSSRGNIFGKGVSFSPIGNYASNYSDKQQFGRTMFLMKVLVSNSCIGNKTMLFPPKLASNPKRHYDTSQKPDGHVLVKFNDDEFYPMFLIKYSGLAIQNNKKMNIY